MANGTTGTNEPAAPNGTGDAGAGAPQTPRRSRRPHRRVVRKGTEWFDADGVKTEPSDERTRAQRDADDDRRILGELPPHWGVFSERE
ncbi:hypothetical protein [Bifidobacterium moraviense]|uniref:hypothetical protein n=1 Tax=Bifidobacterium moraviense TaxID=2675323 RepID=UPI002FFBB10F